MASFVRPGLLILGIVLIVAGFILMGPVSDRVDFDIAEFIWWFGLIIAICGAIAVIYWVILMIQSV